MHSTLKQLAFIQNKINEIINRKQLKTKPEIVVVSKTFPLENIMPLLDYGHIHYGENKIQEAEDKWSEIKKNYKNLQLHMVGKLQTNKVKHVIPLFDYIHSLDNLNLAEKIATYQLKLKKEVKIFIQVNVGNESQKNGIETHNLESFYKKCIDDFNLKIIGIMCIPPNDNLSVYFSKMRELSDNFKFSELSMGMSNDYLRACRYKATFLRIGSKIFGSRN